MNKNEINAHLAASCSASLDLMEKIKTQLNQGRSMAYRSEGTARQLACAERINRQLEEIAARMGLI